MNDCRQHMHTQKRRVQLDAQSRPKLVVSRSPAVCRMFTFSSVDSAPFSTRRTNIPPGWLPQTRSAKHHTEGSQNNHCTNEKIHARAAQRHPLTCTHCSP